MRPATLHHQPSLRVIQQFFYLRYPRAGLHIISQCYHHCQMLVLWKVFPCCHRYPRGTLGRLFLRYLRFPRVTLGRMLLCCHLSLTVDPKRVSCQWCLQLQPPHVILFLCCRHSALWLMAGKTWSCCRCFQSAAKQDCWLPYHRPSPSTLKALQWSCMAFDIPLKPWQNWA